MRRMRLCQKFSDNFPMSFIALLLFHTKPQLLHTPNYKCIHVKNITVYFIVHSCLSPTYFKSVLTQRKTLIIVLKYQKNNQNTHLTKLSADPTGTKWILKWMKVVRYVADVHFKKGIWCPHESSAGNWGNNK